MILLVGPVHRPASFGRGTALSRVPWVPTAVILFLLTNESASAVSPQLHLLCLKVLVLANSTSVDRVRWTPAEPEMDPLSLVTSVIAVAELAAKASSAVLELRALCKSLPGRLHAMNNEVADLALVLSQVVLLLEQRAVLPDPKRSAIPHLLDQATAKLKEFEAIVLRLSAAAIKSKIPLLAANAWHKEQGRLQALQDDIRTVKASLNIMLGASNS